MVTGRTIVHAIIGAVVGVVLSFIPFSTVIGGAVAGFLEGPDNREGAIVGALVGAITFLPFVGIGLLLIAFMGVGIGTAGVPIGGALIALLFFVFALSIVLLYTVGMAVLGGYLGAYLAREYPDRRTSTRRTIGIDERPTAGTRSHDRAATIDRTRSRHWQSTTSGLEDDLATPRHDDQDSQPDATGPPSDDASGVDDIDGGTAPDETAESDLEGTDETASTRSQKDRESDRETE
ncbi:DUF5518 domain-containing protein [Salinadaptatus halalkaliphilus]|uniref:DUF5518 domain-containing protein n=1 Tax=Salinadaptatus halalkaliphilus TaxID=2419781 RepID=UPI0015808D9C|nr:DUF5518 domain-containing protein [Salinadaptatus halalkaliphilus]